MNKVLSIIIALIAPVIFNACYFVYIKDFSATRWISYGAIHVAYLLLLTSVFSFSKVKGGVVYGYPKIFVAYSCLVATFGLGLRYITLNIPSPNYALMTFAITIGSYLLTYAFLMRTEAHSIANDERDARHLQFIRDGSETLAEAMRQTSDAARRKQIERLYDAVRNAQVTSVPEVNSLERQILSGIREIGDFPAETSTPELVEKVEELRLLLRKRDIQIRQAR